MLRRPLLVVGFALFLFNTSGGSLAMAETPTDDLQKQIDQLKKETDLLIAEKAKRDAAKALEATQAPSAQQLADLQSQKALADAQKGLADSVTQATLAKYIGDVKAGPYSGSVDMKGTAGTEEAALLATSAVREAAVRVASELPERKQSNVYIFAAREFPNFQRLLAFRFRKEIIKLALTAAVVKPPDVGQKEALSPTLVSAGLDAFSKILGFFKTDYTVGGSDVKVDEAVLLYSVAGELRTKAAEVHLPLVYEPKAQSASVKAVTIELAELVDLRARASTLAGGLRNQIAKIEKEASEEKVAAKKEAMLATGTASKLRLDQLNGVIALYDSFASALTTPDANGVLPLALVAQELAVDSVLKAGAMVLLLRLENSGGGYLLKKNLWTGLGSMPLFHMGGATVSYLALEGADGKVIAGNVVPVYGGFVKSSDLRAKLQEITKSK